MSHQPRASPWVAGRVTNALKGQKPWTEALPPTHSFAPTGRGCAPSIPMAMPWAISLLAFQAAYRVHADNHYYKYSWDKLFILFTFVSIKGHFRYNAFSPIPQQNAKVPGDGLKRSWEAQKVRAVRTRSPPGANWEFARAELGVRAGRTFWHVGDVKRCLRLHSRDATCRVRDVDATCRVRDVDATCRVPTTAVPLAPLAKLTGLSYRAP